MNPDKPNPTATQTPPALADGDDRDPTKEELLEELRVALRDTLSGEEGIPAREGLEAIRLRIYGDADNG